MKWAYNIGQKTKAALLLAVIFVLIFAKNIMDKNNVTELGNSFSSVYEDRLLAANYIYKLSEHLYQKKIMIGNIENNTNNQNLLKSEISEHNMAINSLIANYEKTKLTETETTFFSDLKKNINDLIVLESIYINNTTSGTELSQTKTLLENHFSLASTNLNRLSSIQVSEGKILNENSKKIISGSSILTQFELVLLIGIGIIIQVLIFASNSIFSRIPQKHSLN